MVVSAPSIRYVDWVLDDSITGHTKAELLIEPVCARNTNVPIFLHFRACQAATSTADVMRPREG